MTATPNHALQRTAPAVTLAASGLRLSGPRAASAPASAVAELGVVRPMDAVTAYEQAAPGSRQLTDALHRELSALLPDTNRRDAASQTSFGATGYNKFVFAYPSKSRARLLVFFLGDIDDRPSALPGMPAIRPRDKLNGDLARRTPYCLFLDHQTEVAPLARFLTAYSLPKAVPKRSVQTGGTASRLTLPEEVSEQLFREGHATQIIVNRYERDPQARAACIAHHGTRCAGCGLSMEVTYGSIARGFIHVHHVIPLSRGKRSYTINPKLDLIPLCPNCHAVTHLADPPLSLELLKRKLTKA